MQTPEPTYDLEQPIGLIGLGLLGSAIAETLIAAGYTVVGYDLDFDKTVAIRELGGWSADSPRHVTDAAERIILSLPDSKVVREVAEGPEGLLAGDRLPRYIIDTTTGDPDETVALAARLAERGLAYLDATISGSSEQIRCRAGTFMVGGTAEAFERNRDLFEVFSDRVYHLGPAGSGCRAKLASNLVLGLNRAALAEGLVFAERLGLDLGAFLEVLKNSPAYSVAMDVKGRQMIDGDFTPTSRIRQHLKDVELILDYARRAGQPLPLSTVHQQLLARAVAAGDGDLDNAAIIREIKRSRSK